MGKQKIYYVIFAVVALAMGTVIGLAIGERGYRDIASSLGALICPGRPVVPNEQVIRVISAHIEDPYSIIDIEYPQFSGQNAMNAAIKDQVETALSDHRKNARENWRERIENSSPRGSIPTTPPKDQKMRFLVTWELAQATPKRTSALVDIYDFNGGAHGTETQTGYTYDNGARYPVTLASLFPKNARYLDTISSGSIAQLEEQLGTDSETIRWIKEGAGPKLENFDVFTIDQSNVLRIYFGDYQVGPHSIGLHHVEFPLEMP